VEAQGGARGARGEVDTREPSRLERTAARSVAESKATVPHLYAEAQVEMDGWAELLARPDALELRYVDAVVWAAARALREVPRVNGAYRDGHFELYGRVNVGIAVPADGAFLVPTIADADRLGLAEIAAAARELEAKVREGRITQPELSGGTFTVAKAAGEGLAALVPVVHRGQAAILGMGDVARQPVVRDGRVEPGYAVRLTLACDSRMLSPSDAAAFLGALRALLAAPPDPAS
jgi:pyruvate dehydrogenase E2 component (dihydrolipoamide acetyltransferase)